MNKHQRKMARQLLSRDAFIELTVVLDGIKPAMRHYCKGDKAEKLAELAGGLGLAFDQSEYALEEGVRSGGVVHTARPLPKRPEAEDPRYIYIGADVLAVRLAKSFDARDDSRFGAVLGYPKCCIEFFSRHYGPGNNDLVADVRPPESGRHEPLINCASRHFGYRLISHFPCRWDCEASMAQADRALAGLMKHDPVLAEETLNALERDVVYSPEIVIAIRDARWEKDVLPLKPGTFLIAGNLEADCLRLDGSTVVAFLAGLPVARLERPAWLPFQSQHHIEFHHGN